MSKGTAIAGPMESVSMKADKPSKAGKLRRVEIEPAKNGFSIEEMYEGKEMYDMSRNKLVATSIDEAMKIVRACLEKA